MNRRTTDPPDAGDVFPGVLNSQSLEFVESLQERFHRQPDSVGGDWRQAFRHEGNGAPVADAGTLQPSFRPRSLFHPPGHDEIPAATPELIHPEVLQERVDQLIRNYRVRGHRIAAIDPLNQPRPHPPELEPAHYGFTKADLDRTFSTATTGRPHARTLRQILAHLRRTYCGAIGVQFMHIDELQVREWLQERMERTENHIRLDRKQQLRVLTRLTDAAVFEHFLLKKFIGAKSYSLEGAESLIPLLDLAIDRAGEDGVEEIVVGMAHRGRLNVMANIIGKSPRQIFREFEDRDAELFLGGGDVKHHLGYSGEWTTRHERKVHLSLCFNPSHLEFVNPVALGRVRAKQDRFRDDRRIRCMALLIHGDAAFCGEGIVQEMLNLSELSAYHTGGTLHVIVNNQLGFTTPHSEGCSGTYVTDVARLLQLPIFHVNGEDPEAVAQAVELAMAFRSQFQRDAVIDMYCYRRHGHNEGDDPTFTQPVMYREIEQRPSVRESYRDRLLQSGEITLGEAEQIADQRHERLERDLRTAREDESAGEPQSTSGIWKDYRGGPAGSDMSVTTGVETSRLSELLQHQTELPGDFHPHPKIERALTRRREMAIGDRPLNWSAAESLAFASLATEGFRVRLTGQDAARGTFSQRHAVLHDSDDGHVFVPLQHLTDEQAPVEVHNSPLCEAGALGFEYGYSLDCPDGLIVWEAQFGDFANAAQVIFDQFVVSAEDKWKRLSGLVVLLPHGYEGLGPEHSSARIERFLTLAAEDNIQVACPTTPAQYFHVLRRQVLRRWRKPLIVFTPKSLLRHKACVSSLKDLSEGSFGPVIAEPSLRGAEHIERALLCSGKVFYELAARRDELNRRDVAIVRLEQLYPFPVDSLRGALESLPDDTPVTWVQEEPENAGGCRYLRVRLGERLLNRFPFTCVSRPESASPATGSKAAHKLEQKELIDRAFGGS